MSPSPELFIVLVLVLAVLASLARGWRRRSQGVVLAELRAGWGRSREARRPLERIARFHERRAARDGMETTDPGTWADLGLDDLFTATDRTVSPVGQQVLYDWLGTPLSDPAALRERDVLARRLGEDAALRERVQLVLQRLDTPDALYLPNLFLEELPPRPAAAPLFPLLTAAAAVALAATPFFPGQALLALLALSAVNLAVQHRYRGRILGLVRPMRVLHALAVAGGELGRIDDPALAGPAAALRRTAPPLQRLGRASRWLVVDSGGDELSGLVYAYVNMLFLLDVNAFVRSVEGLRRGRAELEAVFRAVGELDASVALASWRAGLPVWTSPEFVPAGKRLDAVGLRHPLVEDAVPNDLRVDGVGVLITGSNMSGKTTFMRAVALNALLARTLATCTAERWRAPLLAVRTSIGREDSLGEGRSFFFAEAEAIGDLLRSAEAGGEQHLFAIDEIFRGTNTTERIAAATAVLERLNRGPHLVLCSTHDLELLELLGAGWEFHHFREEVVDGELRFDYRMRPGASSTRNAIRLLELSGYPAEVVRAADRTALALLRLRRAAARDEGRS